MTSWEPSFWEVDDLNLSESHVRDMVVAPATTADVDGFCRRFHYTATGGNAMWRWGLWDGPTLVGVIAYNLPTRRTCGSVFGIEHFDKVWHMGRLALADDAPRNSESRLIGGSLRAIRSGWPNTWAVLTYAATDMGHIGYVYQATNTLYTGTGGTTRFFTDPTGRRRSDFLDGHRVSPSRASGMGWVESPASPKHRYVYVLGNKTQRRERLRMMKLPILPYPKAAPSPEEGAA